MSGHNEATELYSVVASGSARGFNPWHPIAALAERATSFWPDLPATA